jgi:4-amino-4-deoxy-L-arabinose transferase-like glycosyltransferase
VRRSSLPVVLLATLVFFGGLGRGAITDSDEAFYAEAAREMVESGDWLTPHFNYEPRFQKPALYYWLTAATYQVTGPTAFAARFWSALAGLGLVIVTIACGRRWYDDETGLLAGAIVATSFGHFALARMALPDLPLAFLVTLTTWAALMAIVERDRDARVWLLLAAGAAALGFLMKGPLAVVLPGLVVLPVLLVERRVSAVRPRDIVLAAALFLLIAAPWYVAMWIHHGNEYVQGFFVGDNYERFATDRFNDPRPWWFYLPVTAGGLLPWTPLMLVWVTPVLQFLARQRDLGVVETRLLVWVMLPLAFFTLSVGKQPRYILPILLPLALLLAASIVERTRDWRSYGGTRMQAPRSGVIMLGSALGGAVLILLGALVYRARPLFLDVSDGSNLAAVVVSGLGGMAVVLVSMTRAWRTAPAVLAVAAALTFGVLPHAVMPAPADATVRQLARSVREARAPDEAIGTYRVFVRNLVFHTGIRHTDLIHDDHLVDWVRQHPRALIVMPAADADRLERERGVALERLAELRYFDEGGLRLGMLLWPDPDEDLERIVLVRALS